jgi:hypothetical protein
MEYLKDCAYLAWRHVSYPFRVLLITLDTKRKLWQLDRKYKKST